MGATQAVPQTAAGGGLDFDDAQTAFRAKGSAELAKGLAVFSLCRVQPLVQHAGAVLGASRRLAGDRATDWLMKRTFFGHFCAGGLLGWLLLPSFTGVPTAAESSGCTQGWAVNPGTRL